MPDGRLQTVEYTADSDGYKPKITYEQVGGYPSGGPGGYPSGGPTGYPAANGGGNGGYQY